MIIGNIKMMLKILLKINYNLMYVFSIQIKHLYAHTWTTKEKRTGKERVDHMQYLR